jgi:hypothetical protein
MIVKCFKIIIIFIFEIILIDTNAIASIVDDCRNSSFYIQNIKVDITKKNLLEARSAAEEQSKKIALSRLLSRLTLNNSIITPENYKELNIVEYLKINSEANSNKRYKADFDICFNREAVIKFFLKNKLQYAETYRKPISVLPIYRGPRGFILWDPNDLWYSVWNKKLKTLDGLVKLKLAKGSLYLKRNMTTKVILNSDENIIKKLAENENTDSVLLVVAEPIMLNDGKTYLSTYAKLFDNTGKLKNVLPGNKTPLKTKISIYNIEERMFQDEVDNILNSIELNWKIDNVIDPNISNRVDLWIPIPISASSILTEPLILSNKSITVKSIVGFNKSGIIKINDELISYKNKAIRTVDKDLSNSFEDISRGLFDTQIKEYRKGDTVVQKNIDIWPLSIKTIRSLPFVQEVKVISIASSGGRIVVDFLGSKKSFFQAIFEKGLVFKNVNNKQYILKN